MYIAIKNPNPTDDRNDETFYIKLSEITDFEVTQYATRRLGRWYKLKIRIKDSYSVIIHDEDRNFIDRIISAITKEGGCISLQR